MVSLAEGPKVFWFMGWSLFMVALGNSYSWSIFRKSGSKSRVDQLLYPEILATEEQMREQRWNFSTRVFNCLFAVTILLSNLCPECDFLMITHELL